MELERSVRVLRESGNAARVERKKRLCHELAAAVKRVSLYTNDWHDLRCVYAFSLCLQLQGDRLLKKNLERYCVHLRCSL